MNPLAIPYIMTEVKHSKSSNRLSSFKVLGAVVFAIAIILITIPNIHLPMSRQFVPLQRLEARYPKLDKVVSVIEWDPPDNFKMEIRDSFIIILGISIVMINLLI